MWRRVLTSLGLPVCVWCTAAAVAREAPHIDAVAANQLVVAGNACGPAALLNAFRCGNPDWQRAGRAVAGSNDKERILAVIREIGMRPSKNVPGHPRWSRRGVSVTDLKDMANEMSAGRYLPLVSDEVLFLKPRETPEQLLRRVYQRFDTSLARGLPPVVSLRRYALRAQPGAAPQWVVIDAHFVTLTALPRPLEKHTRSFPVSYIDPWGARRCQGSIGIPGRAFLTGSAGHSSCLAAEFPQAAVGKTRVRRGEETVLAVAATIGRW